MSQKEPLYPPGPSSDTGDAVPMPIQGRFQEERQRLAGGFTDADRAWRKQWLKDQILHESEPVVPPNFYKQAYNPIRRMYKAPLDLAFKPLTPIFGQYTRYVRHFTGKALMGLTMIYGMWYYAKYNSNDWTRRGGWKVKINEGVCYPGEPDYPRVSRKKIESDYGPKLPADVPI